MRRALFFLPVLLIAAGVHAEPAAAPYEGLWASTAKACRDPEGVHHLGIKDGQFAWYETYCRSASVRAGPDRSWTFRLSCEGEGEKFKAKPRIAMPSDDRLIMYDAPVVPTKRQTYVRCSKSVPTVKDGNKK